MSNASATLEQILTKLRGNSESAKRLAIEEILDLKLAHPNVIEVLKSIATRDENPELRQSAKRAISELERTSRTTEMLATASRLGQQLHKRLETTSESRVSCIKCGAELPLIAKFCLNCGTPITNAVQHSQVQPPKNAPATKQSFIVTSMSQSYAPQPYEICEIRLERIPPRGCLLSIFEPNYCFFKAEVIGGDHHLVARTPDLVYKLMWLRSEKDGDSDYFDSVKEVSEYQKAVDSLSGDLTKEGWQLLAVKGEHWYNHRLQR